MTDLGVEDGVYVAGVPLALPKPPPAAGAPPPSSNPLAADLWRPETHSAGVRVSLMMDGVGGGGGAPLGSTYAPPQHPRASLLRNKSSLLARATFADGYQRRVAERLAAGGVIVVANVQRSLIVVDGDGLMCSGAERTAPPEIMARVLFAQAWPLCHAVNAATASRGRQDVVVGTSGGDVLWLDLVAARYQRVNKGCGPPRAAVTAVAWVPGAASLAVAGFSDGHIVVYDTDAPAAADEGAAAAPPLSPHALQTTFYVCQSSRSPRAHSVVAAFRVSMGPVRALTFVDAQLAVACADGFLRMFDLQREAMPQIVPSLFGGLCALAISPDGRLLAVGGQDDTVAIFDVRAGPLFVLLARCVGHAAWVTAAAFDPFECAGASYRLASVGEDGRLLLWNYVLPTPAVRSAPAHKLVGSSVLINVVARGDTATVVPLAVAAPFSSDTGPASLSDVFFSGRGISVVSTDGFFRHWSRPVRQPCQ